MANKKNLPHIPIYVGDWERDCNVLSLESEAAWLRVIFKMFTKGKQDTYKIPTKSLQNLWRCSAEKMRDILDELIFNEISDIKEGDGFVEFTCRRFVKENNISRVRAKAVSNRKDRGGDDSTNDIQTSYKQSTKHIQNTDNDNDIDNDNVIDIENEEKGGPGEKTYSCEIWPSFDDFWDVYDKKVGKKDKIKKKWEKLPQETKEKILEYLPRYKEAQPEKQYRKNPETFLNNESWNDEIIEKKSNNESTDQKIGRQSIETIVRNSQGW